MAVSKKKIITWIITLVVLIGIISAYKLYDVFYKSNVNANCQYLYIPNGCTFDELIKNMRENRIIENETDFKLAAKLLKFKKVIPGKYKVESGMSNKSLIFILRSGRQTAVRFTFAGNIRSNKKIASIVSRFIDVDSVKMLHVLNDNKLLENYGFNRQTVIGMFIPNTYEIYWNTTPENFIKRMYNEYNKFWNGNRTEKLELLGLTRNQVSVLASIINEETNKTSEMARIAGVYINRLNHNMFLQADPTVKFALGDFSIKRILVAHTKYNSPYNTYIHEGIPPAPICMPSVAAIDAVLNYEHHQFYFFCAKDDFSGYHNFAKNILQHNINAAAYQRALNKLNIR